VRGAAVPERELPPSSPPAASSLQSPDSSGLSSLQPPLRAAAGPLTFTRLKWTSFFHSCVYVALLICAFAAGNPQPLTFVLGLTHGLLWIFMSLACLTAARLRIVSLRLAVAVAVLGGVGPFFGSYEFIREQRKRAALE